MAAKVLLVEDDNNLREIYEARLLAEGYNIVTARDGEEALVVAKAEQPDLVISDVMMPRVSGFEMLDILRNTENLKDTKVIMLTALGQADDKTRANSLGADRYLVKSQVTLEDIVKAAHELLEGPAPQAPAAAAGTPTPPVATPTPVAPSSTVTPVQPAPAPQPVVAAPPVAPVTPLPAPDPMASAAAPLSVATPPAAPATEPVTAPTTSQEQATVDAQINNFVQQPAPAAAEDDAVLAGAMHDLAASTGAPTDTASAPVTPAITPDSDPNTQAPSKKVIQPLNEPGPKPSVHELLAKEGEGAPTTGMPGMVISPGTAPAGAVPQPPVPPMPTAPAPTPQPGQSGGFDPNSVSL